MTIIQRGRGAGKTTELIAWLRENPIRKLVVATAAERDRLRHQYALTDVEYAQIVVARGSILRGTIGDVAVDNVDWVLAEYLGRSGSIWTITEQA